MHFRPLDLASHQTSSTEFRVQNPNEYIVVLSDDILPQNVSATAHALANAHGGVIKHTYSTALKGFSVRLPEAAAIALSNDPRVLYVEENGTATVAQTWPPPTPWGLDRIDQFDPIPYTAINETTWTTNASYNSANDGAGVHVYVIDTGMSFTHHQFTSRVSTYLDGIDDDNNPATDSNTDGNGLDGRDCVTGSGHGTLVASIIGGNSPFSGETSFGVAKGVTLHPVRSIYNKLADGTRQCGGTGVDDEIIHAIDLVTQDVTQNNRKPAVANMSWAFNFPEPSSGWAGDAAVRGAIAAGVTCVVAAFNGRPFGPQIGVDASQISPAREPLAITVGSTQNPDSNNTTVIPDSKPTFSNYGPLVDVFAPGVHIPGAAITSDSASTATGGTSVSAPLVTGVVAMYLHDHPDGPASLPAVVQQVIKSNANICDYNVPCTKIANRNTGSPDRLLYSGFLPTPANPIYNQRFFVWQQYQDFQPKNSQTGQPQPEPDEAGLDYWTRNILGHCGRVRTDVNYNDQAVCTEGWRANTSLAFWVDSSSPGGSHEGWLSSSGALAGVNDDTFVRECYKIYLKRDSPLQGDVDFWRTQMQCYNHSPACNNDPSDVAGVQHIIDAFLVAADYELRFGPHS